MHGIRLQPVVGALRLVADAAISLSVLHTALRQRRTLNLRVGGIARFIRSQHALAAGLRHNKYMRFDGKLFVDAFTPHWPSPAFERMVSVYAANADKPEAAAQDYVTYFALAITRKCAFRCAHCYAIRTLGQRDELSLAQLLDLVERILDIGVGVISLEGGEPLLRFADLLEILRAVRGRANPVIATTGWGLTAERAAALKLAGLVGAQISLDHHEAATHNELRGNPKAFDAACQAVHLFREAGVFPILAVCPTPQMVQSGGLWKHLELARDLGAGMLQVLDPMPAGRLLDDGRAEAILTPAQLEQLCRFHVQANADSAFYDHPAVSVRAFVEQGCRFGCGLGGNQHCYVAATGDVLPCVYLHLSFGNILEEDFGTIFRRMRAVVPRPVDGLCPVYEVAPAIARARRPDDGAFLPVGRVPQLAQVLARRGLPGLFRRARGEPSR